MLLAVRLWVLGSWLPASGHPLRGHWEPCPTLSGAAFLQSGLGLGLRCPILCADSFYST